LERRLAKLREQIAARELDGLLVLGPENRRYLSGFTGSSGALLITQEQAFLVTDFRYVEQARAEAPGFSVVQHTDRMSTCIAQMAAGVIKRLGFESNFMTYHQFEAFSKAIEAEMIPVSGVVEALRMVKDPDEVRAISEAARIADEAFSEILGIIKPGVTEKRVALELEYLIRMAGSSGVAFESICVSGVRSSMPHGTPSDKPIESGDLVTLDFGAVIDGYRSDMTRTVIVGEPSEEQKKLYELVLDAQTRALSSVAPGKKCKEVDEVARRIINEAGHAEHFGHGLGHGVGLAVHEEPRLSPSAEDTSVLEPGMVVTVEPGVYVPGKGGVRIEDLVLVTETGHSVLSRSPKYLMSLK